MPVRIQQLDAGRFRCFHSNRIRGRFPNPSNFYVSNSCTLLLATSVGGRRNVTLTTSLCSFPCYLTASWFPLTVQKESTVHDLPYSPFAIVRRCVSGRLRSCRRFPRSKCWSPDIERPIHASGQSEAVHQRL